MKAEIARLDLRARRRSLIGYAVGLGLYTFIVVAIYPEFKNTTSLNNLTKGNSAAAALFGATGSITSPSGWLNANIFENFFPLILLLVTVGYGAYALAGQDEDGTLCLLTVLPISRRAIAIQKALVMATLAVVLAVAVAAFTVLGRSFDVSVPATNVAEVSLAVAVMAIDFGLLTMAVGALAGRKSTALAVGATLAAVSYILSALAPVAAWIRPAKYLSLFYWSVGNEQVASGVDAVGWLVLIGVGLAALWLSVAGFRRLDVH